MKIHVAVAITLFGLALTPVVAKADAQEDQQACMNDAMTICGQFIPDRERVGMCLVANRSRISQACRMALVRFNPRAKTTAAVPVEDRLTPR